ncbi:MAG: 5-amino-6-(D-ribitylamino)uracil--L-tyrosine 4-hydroxyphenyl transferase CofH [Polyangiales bacterium]
MRDLSLDGVGGDVRAILERALSGRDPSWEEGVTLCRATNGEHAPIVAVADRLRAEQCGEDVGYVVNRNVNFTNVCVKACRFCAFSRASRSEEGYFLPTEEIVRRVVEAHALGATEVCIQAGLPPGVDGDVYVDLCRAVKTAVPNIHVHAFSPEEVKYGAGLAGVSIRDYLRALQDVGLGSLPGTSAEILDDAVRARISAGRITTREWMEVISSAHAIGLPTTSTIMFGHVETDEERMRHLDLLRSMQRETGGFTELVPLSFVHQEAPLFLKRRVDGVRPGASDEEVIRFFAIARLMLGRTFRNLQASWVKQGLALATKLLACGANDLGGTLMNESISTSAGAAHGQLVSPRDMRRAIRSAGRTPVERSTLYVTLRRYGPIERDEDAGPLDRVDDPTLTFGTYRSLTLDERVRFRTAG